MSRYFLRSCLTDPRLSPVYFLQRKKGTLENSHVHTPTSLATMNLLYPYKYRKTPAVSPLNVDLPQKKEDSLAWRNTIKQTVSPTISITRRNLIGDHDAVDIH